MGASFHWRRDYSTGERSTKYEVRKLFPRQVRHRWRRLGTRGRRLRRLCGRRGRLEVRRRRRRGGRRCDIGRLEPSRWFARAHWQALFQPYRGPDQGAQIDECHQKTDPLIARARPEPHRNEKDDQPAEDQARPQRVEARAEPKDGSGENRRAYGGEYERHVAVVVLSLLL